MELLREFLKEWVVFFTKILKAEIQYISETPALYKPTIAMVLLVLFFAVVGILSQARIKRKELRVGVKTAADRRAELLRTVWDGVLGLLAFLRIIFIFLIPFGLAALVGVYIFIGARESGISGGCCFGTFGIAIAGILLAVGNMFEDI